MQVARSFLCRVATATMLAVLPLAVSSPGLSQERVEGMAQVRSLVQQQGTTRVIVQIAPPALPEGVPMSTAALLQVQSEVSRVLAAAGAEQAEAIPGQPYLVMEIEPGQLDTLAASDRVVAVQEDTIAQAYLADSVPLVRAPDAWNLGARGAGRVVAILDSGVDAGHGFLGGRVVSEACFSSNSPSQGATTLCPNGLTSQFGPGAAEPCTAAGCDHGTHVAGIIGGNGPSFSGVAPDVSILAVQVFSLFTDRPGGPQNCASLGLASPCILTFLSDQIRGLQRVIDRSSTLDISSVNMSLGGGRMVSPCDTDLRKAPIDQLRTLGTSTVIASGNNGFADAVGAPGCISTAVTVGSTTKVDTISGFSNSANMVDLLAPGSSINSSVTGGGFGLKSGTSMATPHVAGAIAVMHSADPTRTIADIEAALAANGVPIVDPRNTLSRPRINIAAALGVQPAATLQLALADPGRRLGNGDSMGVTATVNAGGSPLPGAAVEFDTDDPGLLSVAPTTATTNAAGMAQTTVTGETSSSGSTRVTAQLANGMASDGKTVLVPDVSAFHVLLMLFGVAAYLRWAGRR